MRDWIETYTLLILALALFIYACESGLLKQGCDNHEANETEINLTTKGESE